MHSDPVYPPAPQPALAAPVDPAYPPPGQHYEAPPAYGVQPSNYGPPPPAYSQKGSTVVPPVGGAGYSTTANTVVITQPGTYGYVPHDVYPDNTGAIIFSCMVTWCCCCILGLIAFVYAITSRSQSTPKEAFQHLRISKNLSVAGLVAGIIIYIVSNALRVALLTS